MNYCKFTIQGNFECKRNIESFENSADYINVYRDKSTLKNAGYGMFSKKNFKKGNLIESCTYLAEEPNIINKTKYLKNYVWEKNGKKLMALGYCPMYNHKDRNNAYVKIDNNFINIYAKEDINKNKEIFISYGANYWKSRGIKPI